MTTRPLDGKLNLKNDGTLELFFIGTGGAFARDFYQTNFLIVKGDVHVMVDFGMTGVEALRRTAGLDVTDISVLLPTHSHADHIGGLEFLTLMNRYVGIPVLNKPRLSIIVTGEYRDILWNMSLRGGMGWNEVVSHENGLGFNDYYNVIRPIEGKRSGQPVWTAHVGDLKVELFRTNHIPDKSGPADEHFVSYGLLIDDRVFYSGDTKFDPGLIERYSHVAEVFFHDAGLAPNPVHASVPELMQLDDDIKRRMFLVHYPDNAPATPCNGFAGWTRQGVRYIFD